MGEERAVPRMRIRGLYDNDIYPARFGGAEGAWRLYRHLAARAEVEVLCLLKSRDRARRSELVEGVRIERRKPVYPTLVSWGERLRLWPMFATYPLHRALGGRFDWYFRARPAVYQFESFLLTAWYDRVPQGSLKVYHAVNVETEYHEPALQGLWRRAHWERRLREIERHAVSGADLILYVSVADRDRLVGEFGARAERMILVTPGFEPTRFEARGGFDREAFRAGLGLAPTDRVAVFTGSAMAHNQDAARFIAGPLAAARPEMKFLIVGGAAPGTLPPNVIAPGVVEDVLPYLWSADVALNPVASGSGSSLKVPEYLAAGLPVVTTAFGMRGYTELLDCVSACGRDEMAAALVRPARLPADLARRLRPYAWEAQVDKIHRAYRAWFENPEEAPRAWASIS